MAQMRSKMALVLCIVMLVTLLPVFALADKAEGETSQICYNLGEEPLAIPANRFEKDGSHTIELEADAFFPYQVKFTAGNTEEILWFMTPEDTVEFAGHLFRVSSERVDPTAITQIGLRVNGKYFPAYPKEKSFEPEAELQSMLPLQEKEFSLDLTGFFPAELEKMQVETIVNGLVENGADAEAGGIAVWAKMFYTTKNGEYISANDHFTVLGEETTIDLSDYEKNDSTVDFTMELIVGTADQLNLDNLRYRVDVTVDTFSGDNVFSVALADEDHQAIAVEMVDVENIRSHSNYFKDGSIPDYGSYLGIVAKRKDFHGEQHYISISLTDSFLSEHPNYQFTASVYEGYYASEDAIPADAEDISAQVWNTDVTAEGGFLANYLMSRYFSESTKMTVVLKSEGKTLLVSPLVFGLSSSGIMFNIDQIRFIENDGWTDAIRYGDSIYPSETVQTVYLELTAGFPTDAEYAVSLETRYPVGQDSYSYATGTQYVKAAYVGEFDTPEAAAEAEAEDIKEQLFPSSYNKNGYVANYAEGVTFTVFDINDEVYKFRLITYETNPYLDFSFGRYLYAGSDAGSSRVRASGYSSYSGWNSKTQTYTYTFPLYADFSANDYLYISGSVYAEERNADNSNGGVANVEKIVVGYYTSLSAAAGVKDIKAELLNSNDMNGGYRTRFGTDGVQFTIFGKAGTRFANTVLHYVAKVSESQVVVEPDNPLSEDTYFRVNGAYTTDHSYLSNWIMPYSADSYYYNGYQTVFLMQSDYQDGKTVYRPITETEIVPSFFSGYKTKMFAGLDKASGTEQISNQTQIPFVSGQPIQYSAASEDSGHLKNYWVTFLTQQSGPRLFVNGTNDESHYVVERDAEGQPVTDGSGEEVKIPSREIFIQEAYGNKHDVFFANIGDEEISGLYVRLENPMGIRLDDYWTIGETTTLSPFTTTTKRDSNDHYVYYGELPNVGKVRLLPITNSEGGIDFQSVGGVLALGYDSDGDGTPEEEVRIQLSGIVGDLLINTETLQDGVKYVPYSQLIQTNNMYADDAITFEIVKGTLPEGMELRAKTGELYGLPMKVGSYKFTVQATAEYGEITFTATKEFTLTILENTDINVDQATDEGYQVLTEETEEHPIVTSQELIDRLVSAYKNLKFVSEGAYDEFVSFYIDGVKLLDGTDFQSSEGSVIIDILERTLKMVGKGQHTIAIEFRNNGEEATDNSYSPMHRTSRNYESTAVVTPPRPVYETVPTWTDDGISPIPLEFTIKGNMGVVKEISKVREDAFDAARNPDAVVDMTNVNVDTVILPAVVLNKLVEKLSDGKSGTGTLTVKMPRATLVLDETCLQSVQEQSNGEDTEISIKPITKDELSKAQKNALSEREVLAGVSLNAIAGDKQINAFDGGRVSINFSTDLEENEKPVSVFYLGADGTLVRHATEATRDNVSFRSAHFSDFIVLEDTAIAFTDVTADAWYNSFVIYAARSGIMVGVNDNDFSPETTINRAMITQILYNLDGKPENAGAERFSDVAADAWYSDAVNWAAEAGIVKGVGDGRFAPMNEITREQLAVMLYNYAKYKGYRTDKLASLTRFTDAEDVSDWATVAMQWAVNEKQFVGMDSDTLASKGIATRAQAAKVLTFFRESFEL